MPRPRQRASLQSGLRLNLNRLIRRGVQPGAYSGREVSWTDSYADEQIASGLITADMSGPDEGVPHPAWTARSADQSRGTTAPFRR